MFGHGHSHSHGHSHGNRLRGDQEEERIVLNVGDEITNEEGHHGHSHHHHGLHPGVRLLKMAVPEFPILFFGLLALLGSVSANLFVPYAMGRVVEATTISQAKTIIITITPILCAGSVATFLRSTLFGYAGERFIQRLRANLFRCIVEQDIGFFDTNKTGELINRLSVDTSIIQTAATMTMPMLLRFGIQIIGGSVLLFFISWRLTLVMLIPLPLIGLFTLIFRKYFQSLAKNVQDQLASNTSVAEEVISNVRYVRSFGKENTEQNRFNEKINSSFHLGKKMALATGFFQGFMELFGYIGIVGIVSYGVILMIQGNLNTGDLTSFLLYAVTVAHALGAFGNYITDLLKAFGASDRVFELMDRKPTIPITGGETPSSITGYIEYRNVSFSYPSRPKVEILHDFNLALQPNTVVGIVGVSGTGKTTIIQLLLRLYDVTGGCIYLDNSDIRHLSPRWLRQQIGYVSQEPVLFNCSILENISYGDPDVRMDEVISAAKVANIHDFVISLEMGYSTIVGERGVRLSGGQKQRISIARALLKNPKIVIFDEATSSLDAESEHLVQLAMEKVLVGRTVMIIAHRLSTIQKAQCIVVMNEGKIVQMGTHDQLLGDQNSLYFKLVSRQLQKTNEPNDQFVGDSIN